MYSWLIVWPEFGARPVAPLTGSQGPDLCRRSRPAHGRPSASGKWVIRKSGSRERTVAGEIGPFRLTTLRHESRPRADDAGFQQSRNVVNRDDPVKDHDHHEGARLNHATISGRLRAVFAALSAPCVAKRQPQKKLVRLTHKIAWL
jgi:hypothetical protein